MASSHCRSCGAVIVWAKTEKGGSIPLDPTAPDSGSHRYFIGHDGTAHSVVGHESTSDAELAIGTSIYISHFRTCPTAAQHSKKQRRAAK